MMRSRTFSILKLDQFDRMAAVIGRALLDAPAVKTATWQSQDVSQRPEMTSYELAHARVELPIPTHEVDLAVAVDANLPWAEDHFQERVSGDPLNPPPSEQWWPYAVNGNSAHKKGQEFSHTYPERFWPKFANTGGTTTKGRQVFVPHVGIRYEYGDLDDVLDLLQKDLYTRQAYLPVWFPEDTGAVEGQRVPCTLGYHFLYRGQLDVEYHIRSCDFMRHWRDDIYMAGRLMQWMSSALMVEPGTLVMNIGSLHIFQGDRLTLEQQTNYLERKAEEDYHEMVANLL